MRGNSVPFPFSPQSVDRAYLEMRHSPENDNVFPKLRETIASRSKILDRSLRIKVHAWIDKLSEESETRNETWSKNRNAYARLLLEQLKCGRLEEPFHVLPPSSPLPTLNKSLLYPYTKTKSQANRRINHHHHQLPLTPSQELDKYLSRQTADASISTADLPPTSFSFQTTATTPAAASQHHRHHQQTEPATVTSSYIHSAPLPDGGVSSNSAGGCNESSSSSWNDGECHHEKHRHHHKMSDDDAQHRVAQLQLRVLEAEEKLHQHSALLELALDIRDNATNSFVHASQQQQQQRRGLEEVLQAAEQRYVNHNDNISRSGKVQGGRETAAFRRGVENRRVLEESGGHTSLLSSSANVRKRVAAEKNHAEQQQHVVVSENELQKRLAQFEEATALLRSKLGLLDLNTTTAAAATSGGGDLHVQWPNTAAVTTDSHQNKGRKQEKQCSSSGGGSGSGYRHTLKSAAAAAATRKYLIDEEAQGQEEQEGVDGVGQNLSMAAAERPSSSAASRHVSALFKPRPGSSAALISEVEMLRKRLAANLSAVEGSMPSAIMAPSNTRSNLDLNSSSALLSSSFLDFSSPLIGSECLPIGNFSSELSPPLVSALVDGGSSSI